MGYTITVNTPTGEQDYKNITKSMLKAFGDVRRHHPNFTSLVVVMSREDFDKYASWGGPRED